MKFETVHIHANKFNRDLTILVILLPIIIFVLCLAIVFSSLFKNARVALEDNRPTVLGVEESK